MIYVLWTLNMIGYVAFTIGMENWKKKEEKGPLVMCVLSGGALIGAVMWIGLMVYGKTAILDENVVTFVMAYFALGFVSGIFSVIHTVKMIQQKNKWYIKAILSEGVVAIAFLLYGVLMFHLILFT